MTIEFNKTNLITLINEINHRYQQKFTSNDILLLINILYTDEHIYFYDEHSNEYSGKLNDFYFAQKLWKEYCTKNYSTLNYPFFTYQNEFKDELVYKSSVRKKGENNGPINLEIKKTNFWTAYKAFKNGNKHVYHDVCVFAKAIVNDKFYNANNKYHELFMKFVN